MRRKSPTRRRNERGFTLTEMLIATVIVIFGLVAVAQLVPASVTLSANNRSDGTALAFAQRQMEALRAQPLAVLSFTDSTGVSCFPAGQICNLGDPTQTGFVGSNVVPNSYGAPIIDFSATAVANYSFTYLDPNDPANAPYDVRWAVATTTRGSLVTGRRIIVGVFRRGMETPTLPITLDTMVEK